MSDSTVSLTVTAPCCYRCQASRLLDRYRGTEAAQLALQEAPDNATRRHASQLDSSDQASGRFRFRPALEYDSHVYRKLARWDGDSHRSMIHRALWRRGAAIWSAFIGRGLG